MARLGKWLAGGNMLLGVWLVAVPFAVPASVGFEIGVAFWNYVLVGLGVALLSGYNWLVTDDIGPGGTLAATGSALLGLWLVVVPFVTDLSAGSVLLWNDVLVGTTIAVLAGYNVYESSSADPEGGRTAT